MWWKLGGLAALAVGILVLLLAPLTTVQVKIDLPPGVTPPTPQHFEAGLKWAIIGTNVFVVVLVLGVALWLAMRIVRHHRTSS